MRAQSLLLLVLILLAAGCGSGGAPPLFEIAAPSETGIRFANTLAEDDSVHNALDFDYMYNGAGVAVADFDGDGRQDLFFAGNMVTSRLYLNRGQLKFDDVTEAAGVVTSKWITGVTIVDIDQDGRPDIYLSVAGPDSTKRGNLLFVNKGPGPDGTPRFVEEAKQYGIADVGYNTQAVFFDYDHDGDLDLYILKNALEAHNRNLIRPKRLGGDAASTDRLYRNEGNGTFSDVSRAAGITIEGYGLGIAVTDFNRDGWPDLYVANDFLSNDLVWINNRNGTFTNQAARYLKHTSFNAMGVDVADYNNDGLVDVMTVDMLPADNQRRKLMYPGSNYDKFHLALELGYQAEYVRNTLQLNDGVGPDGTPVFSEVGQLAGVDATDWSWAPLLADLDNDGLKDLFITNGYRRDVTNLDFVQYLQQLSSMGSEKERHALLLSALRKLPEVKLSNYAFRNRGDLTFSNETKAWGLDDPTYANGAVYVDLDNDGDLDLVVNNIDGPASVYINRSERLPNHESHNFLRFALAGPPGNRAGYGASVTIHVGAATQYAELNPSRGYVSTVEPFLHFGLGAAKQADSVEIAWPDGSCQSLSRVVANQVVKIERRNAVPCPAPGAPPDMRLLERAARGAGLDYLHVTRDLPDFKVTPLLPHKLSEGGPAIAVGDVDGDGRDDIYIGADRGQERMLFLQTAPGNFRRRSMPGGQEYQDMGALLFDADGDGDNDLLVSSGGGFIAGDPSAYQARLYLNDGHGGFTLAPDALPGVSTSASSVVAADYDGDGDLDLFIGGRVIPGKYPLPPRSFLLRNDTPKGGSPRFTDVTTSAAPALSKIGLVTSALFTDFDQDGQTDLLVVGEWMPITFLRNDHGHFVDVTAATGLGPTNGWWNSLVAGDFDHDGDTDYLVGNVGLNTRYRATESEPVRVHAGDFDKNGSIDPVLSTFTDGKSYPVASRDLLVEQMIAMQGRFPKYGDYAKATLEGTLSKEERDGAFVAEAVTLSSSYLENLGHGKFVLRPLPIAAQLAPIFGMLAQDYDGDGNLDVLLVGNSHASETQAGWDDASIGAVLLGDRKGGFRVLNGAASGFFVDGDARAIGDVMVDEKRSLVLVTQNHDSLRVFAPARATGERKLRVGPLDAYASITLAGGATRRQELSYGSSYLSQSSRYVSVPSDAVKVVVVDSRGGSRVLPLETPPLAKR
ncbi:MAG TPA: VCBS repeat-containing protein [Gemmatimonadaceae bacterium]|nr:VCBS repeat-containing protein [Gemmatimonadaceae bacterium]